MDPKVGFQKRIQDLNLEKTNLLNIRKRLALLRLGIFVVTIIGTYQLLLFSLPVGIMGLVAFLASFLWAVKKDTLNDVEIKKRRQLILIYQNELRDHSEQNLFGDGQNYNEPRHPYAFDLDIFGRFSLFNFINRTVTGEGSNTLASWIKTPSEKPGILERQNAAKELSEKLLFKEEFLRTFFLGDKNEVQILSWVNSFAIVLNNNRSLKLLIFILPAITLALLIGGFFIPSLWSLFILSVLVNWMILNIQSKAVTLIHEHINKQGEVFLKYSRLIGLISEQPFTENLTSSLKQDLLKYHHAGKELKRLSRYSRLMDNRYNWLVSALLNVFSFWEIHLGMAVEKWFLKNGNDVHHWLRIIGQFDALLSLAVLHHNKPHWPFPEIQPGYFTLKARGIGHPLLPQDQSITNDYELSGKRNIDIITGSNMAGKSTFLRTLGVNMVLALAGAPVCARSMTVSPAKIMTSMRVLDSLEENASSFYAELERIKQILIQVQKDEQCFLLLDEVLKGTNSNDRHVGSLALMRQFLKNDIAGLIATHDLQLTDIQTRFPENIRNFHFDVKVENEELFFDYKLKQGICQSFNASLLMRKIGIDIDAI